MGTSVAGANASAWQTAAAQTLTTASIDTIAYDLTDGRQGQAWNWRRVGTQTLLNTGMAYGLDKLDLNIESAAGQMAVNYATNSVTIVATDELARNIYSDDEYRDYKADNHGNVFKRAGEKTAADVLSDSLKDNLGYDSEAAQRNNRQAWGQVSGAADSLGKTAADAWDYLNGPDDSLAVTNANALSQSQGQDMMNAERQLASSMNPQTQRALNRDQALIYGNNAAYSEFGDVVSQSMSTDVDRNAQLGVMDGLVNVAPDRAMTEAEVAALGDVPDMVAVPDIDRISQDGLRNQNVDQIDGMSPVSLDGSKKQSRFERMAEVAYDQSPELQEQLGRVLPQLEESQQRMIADRERTKDIPSWVSTLPGSDPIIEDSSIDAALENAYDVARKYSINSVLSLTNAGLTVFASDPVLDVFNVVAGGFPLIDSEEETAQFNTHMKDMYDAGGTPHEGYEVSYREWRWLGQNNTDETYKFTINGNMIDTVAYGSEFPLSNGKPGRSAMVLPNEVDDLMGLGNVTINPNNGRMYQDTYDFDNHTVKESDLLLKQMYETVRNHLNVKAAKDNAGINGVSIKFKVNFDYDGNYWKREVE